MGKKVKEYKSGDFIFAKVKGYPAWPARVQRMNGKKYFVYFYGTGETANLAPNMIFDYVENKDKFLTKTVKRRDFNDGVKQIEHDFANNVPLELVIGAALEDPADSANDSAIDTTVDQTADDLAMDTTTADDTVADTTTNTTAQNETGVEDSDDAGALVIDEGKQPLAKQKKTKAEAPKAASANTPKTPRGRARKTPEEPQTPAAEALADDKQEEIVSRSGRKIRPKRYIDEHTDENATLPSPAAKKRRPTPPVDADSKEKEKAEKQTDKQADKPADKQADKLADKNIKQYNNVSQSDIEDLKEPYKPADPAKENILIAQVPGGKYVGIKIWESRPRGQGAASALQWERTAAANALRLKAQIEKGQVKPQSVAAHLIMDLNLTNEEKAALDKERETEEKKSRVQFLKTEMRLIELDAKIKSCLCLEKADTESCLQLLDQMTELEIAPLMLLKHPTCVETVKRMRAYVGNATSWELTEEQTAQFAKHAHTIRKRADALYRRMKDLFPLASCDPSLSFWEVFSAKAAKLKQLAANNKGLQYDLLEMVHEPPELSEPTPHTMQSAVDAADEQEPPLKDDDDVPPTNNKQAKNKKPSTPAKTPTKRNAKNKEKQDKEQKQDENKEKDKEKEEPNKDKDKHNKKVDDDKVGGDDKGGLDKAAESATETSAESENVNPTENSEDKTEAEKEGTTQKETEKEAELNKDVTNNDAEDKIDDVAKEKDSVNDVKETDKEIEKNGEKVDDNKEIKAKEDKNKEDKKKEDKESLKEEPRAKRSRGESKKTEPPPPRSPTKRKSKA